MMPTMNPEEASKKVEEANFYIQRDKLSEARAVLEDTINCGGEFAFVYLAMGEVCSALKPGLDAKKYYEKAINISSKDNDDQVRVAAKAGLSRIYLQDAIDDFNSLQTIQKIEELEELIPVVVKKKAFKFLAFESNPCNCAYTTSNPFDGRKVFGKCKPCMFQE